MLPDVDIKFAQIHHQVCFLQVHIISNLHTIGSITVSSDVPEQRSTLVPGILGRHLAEWHILQFFSPGSTVKSTELYRAV